MKIGQVVLGSFLALALLSFTAPNQEAPKLVKDAFSHKFPNVKNVKWSQEKNAEWEAEFKMNKTEYSANFLENGAWKETEHSIAISEVPTAVQTSLKKSYPDFQIKEAEVSETKNGSVYEFEIKKGKTSLEVAFEKDGKLVKS